MTAFDLSGQRSTVALDLAVEAERQLGRHENAREHLDHLLRLLPPDPSPRRRVLEDLRQKLEENAASRP